MLLCDYFLKTTSGGLGLGEDKAIVGQNQACLFSNYGLYDDSVYLLSLSLLYTFKSHQPGARKLSYSPQNLRKGSKKLSHTKV